MKKNENIICTVIMAIAIIIAGVLISNAISYGFESLRAAVSYAGELLR